MLPETTQIYISHRLWPSFKQSISPFFCVATFWQVTLQMVGVMPVRTQFLGCSTPYPSKLTAEFSSAMACTHGLISITQTPTILQYSEDDYYSVLAAIEAKRQGSIRHSTPAQLSSDVDRQISGKQLPGLRQRDAAPRRSNLNRDYYASRIVSQMPQCILL